MAVSWDKEKRLGTIFLNGIEKRSKENVGGVSNLEVRNSTRSFYKIGERNGNGENAFHGLVREIKVFKKALNGSEVMMETMHTNQSGMLIVTFHWSKCVT